VHGSREAWDEMARDWPEARKLPDSLGDGVNDPSEHAPIWGSPMDVGYSEREMWQRVGACYVNQTWSAEITVVNGELRAYFCEVAATMAELYGDPGPGMPVVSGWWMAPMAAFEDQVRWACPRCLVPINGRKIKASGDDSAEVYTAAHAPMMATINGRPLREVKTRREIDGGDPATMYLKRGVMPAGVRQ
jgi:hypothetical protein